MPTELTLTVGPVLTIAEDFSAVRHRLAVPGASDGFFPAHDAFGAGEYMVNIRQIVVAKERKHHSDAEPEAGR